MTETDNYKLIDGEAVDLTGEPERKARAHARAETLARAFGSFAPDPAPSESSLQYRKRLATEFQRYSPSWGSADLRPLPKNTFERVEVQIYADAAKEAREPTQIPKGQIVERATRDDSGRLVRRFFGNTADAWAPFKTGHAVVGRFVVPSK